MRNFELPGRSPVYAENGMAATSHPLASSAALSVLKEGGNAVDAAIAASAVLAVVEPQMTGIGGDCFAMVKTADGELTGINGSGRSAANANGQWYRNNGFTEIPLLSAHSVTVPGSLKAWDELHKKFGSLSFERLFKEAIDYAKNGYRVSPRVAFDWQVSADVLRHDKAASDLFLPGGNIPKIGQKLCNPNLAKTLSTIAKQGVTAFYEGPIAADIEAAIQTQGGFLSQADLAAAGCEWVQPVSSEYCGFDVSELPPNGQGIVALIMMNLLRLLNTDGLPADSAERYHLELEAGRVAYAVRDATVADPAFMQISTEELISLDFAKKLVGQINPQQRNPHITLPPLPNADTVYLTVADCDGTMVSFINSIYCTFGSGIVAPQSGVLLQNRGACFSVAEDHPNEINPSKRPMHTIIPAMAKSSQKDIAFGVMGGAYQPMGHLHVFSNLARYGFEPQAALDHPRVFWGEDGVIEVESGISARVKQGLVDRGHLIRPSTSPIGGGQMIVRDHSLGAYIGGSDPRKDGLALGY